LIVARLDRVIAFRLSPRFISSWFIAVVRVWFCVDL